MTTSTSRPEARRYPGRWNARGAASGGRRPGPVVRGALVVAFWVAVWQVAALAVGPIVLAPPLRVVARLGELAPTADFWRTVGHSLLRIVLGFGAAGVAGVLGAAAAAAWRPVDALLTPAVKAVRAAPVVSFVILVLLWVGSEWLALVVAFLMVAPIVYATVLEGIRNRDRALLEMARVFRVPWRRRVLAIDGPQVLPYFVAACRAGMGLAWKAGIAAEVIGLPAGSIGERMYQAKLFLSSADLFAWTAVIVAASFATEWLVIAGLRWAERRVVSGPVVPGPVVDGPVVHGPGGEAGAARVVPGEDAVGASGDGLPTRPDVLVRAASSRREVTVPTQAVGPGGTGSSWAGAAAEFFAGVRRAASAPGRSRAEAGWAALGMRGVTKSFGEHRVVDGLDLTLEPGRVTALTGPNGVGKTTVARLLLGLEAPDAGQVRAPARRAAVFQEDRLCEGLTAVRNLEVVAGRGPHVAAALAAVGLDEESWGLPVWGLSGGQRRRVAVARALVVDADLMVLDEPFSGLDAAGRPLVAAAVAGAGAGRAVLLITHDPADVARFGAHEVRLAVPE